MYKNVQKTGLQKCIKTKKKEDQKVNKEKCVFVLNMNVANMRTKRKNVNNEQSVVKFRRNYCNCYLLAVWTCLTALLTFFGNSLSK